MRVANADQAAAWNGPEGAHWVEHHDRREDLNDALLDRLLRTAEIGPTDVVLDIGCGTGRTTRRAARQCAQGWAAGVDLSALMLDSARAGAAREGVANVRFHQGDAQVYPFPPGRYDVAISMFGVMFFNDPVAAFANIGRALRPEGRLVFACPGEMTGCDWYTVPMAALNEVVPHSDRPSGMFSLADRRRIVAVLMAAGFSDVVPYPVDAELLIGATAAEAADFYLGSGPVRAFMADHPEIPPAQVRDCLLAAVEPYDLGAGVRLSGRHWIVTARWP
ncbi:class I SAM-dependent methyltransferase [Micromonospora sp. C51]|uniref:class I SAM-dependent methyltransferase n=1 Tax=Micromonospora sp. C51 TaxID=2824879 RepID=UPI001B389329|nr:class I SAM-dependent methyltransferase [Micromonospora sp. C51]MBQ1050142.1 class I SAM-dependent methyltransferase [Micromonospora sp. C51]